MAWLLIIGAVVGLAVFSAGLWSIRPKRGGLPRVAVQRLSDAVKQSGYSIEELVSLDGSVGDTGCSSDPPQIQMVVYRPSQGEG